MNAPIRVLLADDSVVARGLLRSILEEDGGIEVVGEAANGREAVELARQLKPNVISMDLEMPVMGGLDAIEEIMTTKAVPILVVSDVADARNACEAVNRGALDVMGKPGIDNQAAADFTAKMKLLAGVSVVTRMRARASFAASAASAASSAPAGSGSAAPAALPSTSFRHVVAIASSTGGPQALARLLPGLPADFPAPVLVAQHIADGFAGGMADWLGGLCRLPVRLGTDGEPLRPGVIYVSPSEAHMIVTHGFTISLRACREGDLYHPSCDALLESVAGVFGRKAIGVILTGMGHDGAAGLDAIRRAGGMTIAQDEASSVIFGMNGVAVERGAAQRILPLEEIAGVLRVATAGAVAMAGGRE